MRLNLLLLVCAAAITSSCLSRAQSISVNHAQAFPNLLFIEPTDIQNAGDGTNRLFVCQKGGIIKVFENRENVETAADFLDLSGRVVTGSEMGLLGLAFHPNYTENGYFYVNYNDRRGSDNYTVISRFSRSANDPNKADPSTELELLSFEQPYANHDGGQIAFGPDGYLYIATGDGGSGGDPLNAGQNLNTYLGKLLRIDVNNPDQGKNYGIPDANPFAGNSHYYGEIYAYGLRNPWRFSFDPPTGRLWVGDVGQDRYEEIDIVEKGGNYGWRTMEGWHCYNPNNNCDSTALIGPVWEYDHSLGNSITGGHVYHGSSVPELEGLYIYADFISGRIWALEYADDAVVMNTLLEDSDLLVSTFGVDEANELYFTDFNAGRIYKFKVGSSVKEGGDKEGTALGTIRPNPAGGRITIPYQLAKQSAVVIAIYNELGKEITRLVDGVEGPGNYEVDFDTTGLSESTYYCRMTTQAGMIAQPITIVR